MINGIAFEIMKLFNVNKFIETGIREGDTLITVSAWFTLLWGKKFMTEAYKHAESLKTDYNIIEIDIDPATIENARRINQGDKVRNIEPICGDSVAVLTDLISKNRFTPTDSCFFYLDAHTAPHSEPLNNEIKELKKLPFPFIVSIDDWDVESLHGCGYDSDLYGINRIRNLIKDRTDVIYETSIPNVHSKHQCFIFMDYYKKHLSPILRHLPLIETQI